MMHTLTRLMLIIAIAGFSLGLGCQSTGGGSGENPLAALTGDDGPENPRASRAGLVPTAKPPVADVPVPIGFKLVEAVSRNYETNGVRLVDHTYEGYDAKFDVERFYRQQMPMKDWKFARSAMVRGEHELHFTKGSEICDITLTSRSTLAGERTAIHVNIQQAAKQPAPAPTVAPKP